MALASKYYNLSLATTYSCLLLKYVKAHYCELAIEIAELKLEENYVSVFSFQQNLEKSELLNIEILEPVHKSLISTTLKIMLIQTDFRHF